MSFSVFVPMIGQHENIGDIVLRRPLLNWLREHGEIHTYIGRAPKGYAEALGVQPNDTVYQSFAAWYWAGLKAAASGRMHYAFKPGEIQLTFKGLKEHVSMLPLLALLRLRGGKVVRVGSGARNFSRLPMWLMNPSVWLSDLVMWRDARTTAYMGSGTTMPDLGYADGIDDTSMVPDSERDVLVLSMRGDRPDLSDQWVEAVRVFAARRSLSIWVVTQVHRDSALSQHLARRLNANLLDWDGTAHDQQERALRELYDKSAVAVSDRLHVLIAAFTHGAVPVGLLTYDSDKIERHFNAAGLEGVCVKTHGLDSAAICQGLDAVTADRARFSQGRATARNRLAAVRQQIATLLQGR